MDNEQCGPDGTPNAGRARLGRPSDEALDRYAASELATTRRRVRLAGSSEEYIAVAAELDGRVWLETPAGEPVSGPIHIRDLTIVKRGRA
ncbi:hypothetical protein ACFXG4_48105 [Nocardia sp. NPDC059246]|uniref:hypothetical protein n=1 Tax=unclassified Nocardia TaxID=2637762 RepID=UPI003691A30A